MKKLRCLSRAVAALLVLSGAVSAQSTVATGALASLRRLPVGPRTPAGPAAGGPRADASYGKLPLAFEPNVGQTDARVRFLTRGGGMTAFLTRGELQLAILEGAPNRGLKASAAR